MRKSVKMISTFLAASLILSAQVVAAVPESMQVEERATASSIEKVESSGAAASADADKSLENEHHDAEAHTKVYDGLIVINEIETSSDWVEITNIGTEEVDLTGWFITDDKSLERFEKGETTPLQGTGAILNSGDYIVLTKDENFNFGLGKSDAVMLYDADQRLVDQYKYTSEAKGSWQRQEDGSFADAEPTKGAENRIPESGHEEKETVAINEVNSAPDDWVELINTGDEDVDLSGFELRDNSNDHRWKFREGTTLKSGELITVETGTDGLAYDEDKKEFMEGKFDIGFGSGDSVRLYDAKGTLMDEYSWKEHASYEGDDTKASYGRYPDGTGAFHLTKETKNQPNEAYTSGIVINEIESNGDETDWVEIYNAGDQTEDISGFYLLDNDPVKHKSETTPLPDGTKLQPGHFYVFEQNKNFTFGLGKNDKAVIYDKSGAIVDEYAWAQHAEGVYARIPDGTGAFEDFGTSTKGRKNTKNSPVVINEVQSNDPTGGADWVELANPTDAAIDVSGLVLKDSKEKDPYTIPEGTKISADGFMVIKQDDSGSQGFKFGLGKGDSVRLFENGELIGSTTWPEGEHTDPTWGLYPDVYGTEYQHTAEATPGAPNKFKGIPEIITWPGSDAVRAFDTEQVFLEDSSGLDFADGKLYAVDNGTATFWVLDVAKNGSLRFADGFETGKRVSFKKDAENSKAKGPDAEGITVDGEHHVYLASERDNSQKGVNYNSILMVNPDAEGERLVAEKEWDLTSLLPQVSANMGVEAVEWVSNDEISGKLIDQNTKKPYDASNYKDAVADGIFFTALEDNGHVYAFVLKEDETAVLIADIDSKLGGAMALDYDTYEDALWVAADDGYDNRSAKLHFNGTNEPDIVHVLPAAGVDKKANNEGFAIAAAEYTVDGERPVYHFCDGVTDHALTIGSIHCDYKENAGSVDEPAKDPAIKDPAASGDGDDADDDSDDSWSWSTDGTSWTFRKDDGRLAGGVSYTDASGMKHVFPEWVKINGKWWPFGEDHRLITGWLQDAASGKWYQIDARTGMRTGLFTDTDSHIYDFDSISGAMLTGWQLIANKWYYFSEEGGKQPYGSMYRNGVTPDGYRVDASGAWDGSGKH